MRTFGAFLKGTVIGFAVMTGVLVLMHSAHAQPASPPINKVAIPSNPPAREMKATPFVFKCVQMGMTPCKK